MVSDLKSDLVMMTSQRGVSKPSTVLELQSNMVIFWWFVPREFCVSIRRTDNRVLEDE